MRWRWSVIAIIVTLAACDRGSRSASAPSASSSSSPLVSGQPPDALPPVAAPMRAAPPEQAFEGRPLALGDGWKLSGNDERLELSFATGSFNSYIARGDVETVDDKWMLRRDLGGKAFVSRYAPTDVSAPPDRRVLLHVGDRLVFGKWTVHLAAISGGSGDQTNKRVMHLHGGHDGRVTSAWQLDPSGATTHDFPADAFHAMSHLEAAATNITLTPDARASSVVLAVREVDRAKPAAFGAPLDPGLYVFEDGTRVLFDKSTSCATGKVCVCTDYFTGAMQRNGERTAIPALQDFAPTTVGGLVLTRRGQKLHVTRS